MNTVGKTNPLADIETTNAAGLEREIIELHRRKSSLERSNSMLRSQCAQVAAERDSAYAALAAIKNSRSWRLTAILRKANIVRRVRLVQMLASIVKSKAKKLSGPLSGRVAGGVPASPVEGRCLLVSPPHTLHLAALYAAELRGLGFEVSISQSLEDQHVYGHVVVFCPNVFEGIKPGFIAVQMEQTSNSRWFSKSYIDKLSQASAIIDYSTDNIAFLRDLGYPLGKVFHVPTGAAAHHEDPLPFDERGIDVLFYGDSSSERRKRLLADLSREFNMTIVNDEFGATIREKIRRAKIVLNIHYYDDALLETVRINECLSLGTPVVSESSSDTDQMAAFSEAVAFAPLDDVEEISRTLRSMLSRSEWERWSEGGKRARDQQYAGFSRQLRRFLYAKGMIGIDDLEASVLSGFGMPSNELPRICLTLSETPDRTAAFNAWPQSTKFKQFDGLRHHLGWIGCALSFRSIMKIAKTAGLRQVLVCEDDVFFPEDYDHRRVLVEEYLAEHDGEWDLFSGLMADVSPKAVIKRVDERDGTKFIWMDRFVSTVYNIYSRNAIDTLSTWDETNTDPVTNTIDRYLEETGRLTVVLAYPFLVGHSEDVSSTIWGFRNTQYQKLFDQSAETIETLLAEYEQDRLPAVATHPGNDPGKPTSGIRSVPA